MSSIFSKIISGTIPSFKIAENENCCAFLDISPLAKGHTLIVPKKEVDYIFDLEGDLYKDLFVFAKEVSKKIEKAISCERIGIAVIGIEVPHAHIHLVPINNVSDIDFSRPKLKFSESEMEEIASAIRNA